MVSWKWIGIGVVAFLFILAIFELSITIPMMAWAVIIIFILMICGMFIFSGVLHTKSVSRNEEVDAFKFIINYFSKPPYNIQLDSRWDFNTSGYVGRKKFHAFNVRRNDSLKPINVIVATKPFEIVRKILLPEKHKPQVLTDPFYDFAPGFYITPTETSEPIPIFYQPRMREEKPMVSIQVPKGTTSEEEEEEEMPPPKSKKGFRERFLRR